MAGTVLVTGGAGYIGSHVVLQLRERGESVVVLDNLCTGFRQAVLDAPLIEGDVADVTLVESVLTDYGVDCVIHCAAHTIVPESVIEPLKYYGNNTCATRNVLACCQKHGVQQMVFLSSAAVYGIPAGGVADEHDTPLPINPYGTSKLISEWMLRDLSGASDFRYVSLRSFNVAGCDARGRIGQATAGATLLVKVACEAVLGKRSHIYMYGTDYETHDGTGVRDYIHVEDLARGHLDALDYLRRGGTSRVLNCGYGHGYSAREVLRAVERVAGKPLDIRAQPRRTGDPPVLIARADRIRDTLGWAPRLDNLDLIIRHSLAWEESQRRQPWKQDAGA